MTDPNRIDVSRAELRDSYTIGGKSVTWLHIEDYALGYDPDTDKLVVMKRGDREIHTIPMANVKGMTLERRTTDKALAAEFRGAEERLVGAPGPQQEAANGRPPAASGAGGGTRRARTAQ